MTARAHVRPWASTASTRSISTPNLPTEQRSLRTRSSAPALVSLLAAAIGILAGIIAYLLYNLIGLFTNICFYHRLSFVFRQRARQSSRPAGDRHSRDRRHHRRHHGALRLRQDSRPWHPRSDGSGADQPQPHRAQSRHSEADLGGHRHRHRRPVRRGRPHHSDWRRGRLAGGPVDAYHRSRAQSAAGVRSRGRHGRDVQHADRRRDSRHRACCSSSSNRARSFRW